MPKKSIIRISFFLFLITAFFLIALICHNTQSLAMGQNKEPTAIILDAETGEPVEGAVAIAIWRKHSMFEGAWFEGGGFKVLRIKEAVSDKQGRIFIRGFWNWHISKDRYPNLTVYKPGYVCWDQWGGYYELKGKDGEINDLNRKNFNKDHPIVKLNKWKKEYSYITHSNFVSQATFNDTPKAKEKLFRRAFDYETKYRIKERTERDRKRKEK